MNEQLRFLQMVEELAQIGKEKNHQLTRAEVETYLQEHGSGVDFVDAISEFLFTKQVLVEGYVPKKEVAQEQKRALYPEEEAFKEEYEEELRMMPNYNRDQLVAMCEQALKDEDAAAELTMALLPFAYEITKEYVGGKILYGDLVQEGSLCVVMFAGSLPENMQLANATGEEVLKAIEEKIHLAIEALIAEEKDTNLEARKVVAKLNQLIEAVEALKEQQAEYTIEDLAEFLAMDIEEIENLLRIAGELEEE